MKNVKYGKCVRCGKTYEAKPDLTNCECGGILDIVYDYDYIRSVLTKEKLARRENRSMWRYRELLPVEETTPDTPLRVGWSPLYDEPNLARALAGAFLYLYFSWYAAHRTTVYDLLRPAAVWYRIRSHSVSNDWSVAEHCRLCRRNAARRHFFY